MIDLHCHILPGIDDGPKTIQETIDMLHIAKDEGISIIAATHHFIEDQHTIDSYLLSLDRGFEDIQPSLTESGFNIRIVKGAEVYISPFLSDIEGIEKLCINNSRYMLMELPMMDIPQYTEDVIYRLRLKGIIPIIAHPERNHRIIGDPNQLYPLIELGALAQVNSGSITGYFGKSVKNCARILFDHSMAHLISTDAHSPKHRAPRMKESAYMLGKWIGHDLLKEVIESRPKAIVDDILIETPQPDRYRKRVISIPFLRYH